MSHEVRVKQLGKQAYEPVWRSMSEFTDARQPNTLDEIWVVEHHPVFTQGQAGKPEHLIAPGDIPVVQTDRGGQVTYHGPGQLVVYPLLNLKRLRLGVRDLVTLIEQSVVELMASFQIEAKPKSDRKISSLGLRVRRGCSFHGVAINVNMDLAPFLRINPCGYNQLQMTQMVDCAAGGPAVINTDVVTQSYIAILTDKLGYTDIAYEGPAKFEVSRKTIPDSSSIESALDGFMK